MTDSPFGGELDEMLSYGFVSLDSTIVTNVQAHLLCYAKGIHGEGRCRIIKTMAGTARLIGYGYRVILIYSNLIVLGIG